MWPAGLPGYRVRFLTLASGLTVRTVERGPEGGRPVLMIPGWGVCAYTFRGNMPGLASAGFRAIAVDLKGHGRSDKPLDAEEYTLGSFVRHVREIMAAIGLERPMIVAQSMAGRVAVELALETPEEVRGLALISPVSLGRVRLIQLGRLSSSRLFDRFAPLLARRAAFKLALETAYGRLGTVEPHEVDEYWAQSQFPGFIIAVRRLLGVFDWDPAPARVAALRVPVTVFRGTRDRIVAADAEAVAAAAGLSLERMGPGGEVASSRDAPDNGGHARRADQARRLLILEGAGHALNEEAPDKLNGELVAAARAWMG